MTAIVLAAMAFLSACTTITDFVEDSPATSKLVVTYATVKAIEQSSDLTSEKVVAFVDRVVDSIEQDQVVTIQYAYGLIKNNIDWDSYSPADQLLIVGLLDVGAEQVSKRIDVGQIDEDTQTTIITVLEWVREGAEFSASGGTSTSLGIPQVPLD